MTEMFRETKKGIIMVMNNTYAYGFFAYGKPELLLPRMKTEGNTLKVSFLPEDLKGRRFEKIRFMSPLCEAGVDDDGYMFYPGTLSDGTVLTRFTERADCERDSMIAALSFAGMGGSEKAVMVHVTKGSANCRFHAECVKGIYRLCPEFVMEGHEVYEELEVTYTLMPDATYSDMARVYRIYQMDVNGCVPLKERIKGRPELEYAADSIEFRIRMGWKPVPTPEFHQNDENEPPLKVVCDIEKLTKLIKAMKKGGIDKAEICLVGWGQGGHDGRFPQQVPSDPAYGGDEKLRDCIAEAREMGYQIVCHTGSLQSYEVADNFSLDAMNHVKAADGCVVPRVSHYVRSGGLSGGAPFLLCPREAYEKYGINELPKVRDYGFRGIHFIDELTAVSAEWCDHPDHPVTRTDAENYYRKLAVLSRELFGGFQSEGWIDFMNSDTDYIMYCSFSERDVRKVCPLFDESIPLWQLVYHGIVLSSPSSATVNHTLKGPDARLYFMEFGGRPLMYLFSKFGERKNWMGDIDLRLVDDNDMDSVISALKEAYDEYQPMKYLQYEFMDRHEKLSDGVYAVTYSDGSVITVDYNKKTYTLKKGDK